MYPVIKISILPTLKDPCHDQKVHKRAPFKNTQFNLNHGWIFFLQCFTVFQFFTNAIRPAYLLFMTWPFIMHVSTKWTNLKIHACLPQHCKKDLNMQIWVDGHYNFFSWLSNLLRHRICFFWSLANLDSNGFLINIRWRLVCSSKRMNLQLLCTHN